MRKLVQVGAEISDTALNPQGKEIGQLLDEAESRVFEIAEAGARGRQGFIPIQPLLTQVMERVDMLYNQDNPSEVTGVPSGYIDLDRMTAGLHSPTNCRQYHCMSARVRPGPAANSS